MHLANCGDVFPDDKVSILWEYKPVGGQFTGGTMYWDRMNKAEVSYLRGLVPYCKGECRIQDTDPSMDGIKVVKGQYRPTTKKIKREIYKKG